VQNEFNRTATQSMVTISEFFDEPTNICSSNGFNQSLQSLYTIHRLRHGSCPFVKIKFKDFQGPYEGYIRRTKLTHTSTFISTYKQVQFTLDNLTPPSINQKLELSEKFTKYINGRLGGLGPRPLSHFLHV